MQTETPTNELIHVLLVEDDVKLAQLTERYFASRGLVTTMVGRGDEAITCARQTRFDVILLDLMLPGTDGIEVCRAIRKTSDVPVIMVTARGEEADRVLGLEVGADDYVSKPFSAPELVARIQAHVRRTRGRLVPERTSITTGRIHVYTQARVATVDGKELTLTSHEFELLRVFAEHPGRVLTREQLLDLARCNPSEVFDRAIDVQISRLRQKLGDDPRQPRLLKTVRGLGYMLASEEET